MEDRIYNQLITEIPEREKHISRYYPFFSIIYKFRSEKCKYNSMKNYIPSIVISILSFMLYEGKLKEMGSRAVSSKFLGAGKTLRVSLFKMGNNQSGFWRIGS